VAVEKPRLALEETLEKLGSYGLLREGDHVSLKKRYEELLLVCEEAR
jgi:hypothetical protein